jgi:dTDP-4-amino-4,6-dideoxygalactose transaminase
MSLPRLREKLVLARKEDRLPRVVVPVHFGGQPTEQEQIWELAREYGFRVLEDASHAIGAVRHGEPVGNCRWSDITVFSFHPVKIITTAEGGMAMTSNPALAKRMQLLRTHGITRDADDMTHAPDGPWYYQQTVLGFNYRMTDVQAALGLSQMSRLEEFLARRHAVAARYDAQLAGLPVITPWQHPDGYSGRHLYVVRLKPDRIKRTHREVFEGMRGAGIGVGLHYIPVYLQPHYERMGFKPGYCPEAERYYAEALSLPLFPGLTEVDQQTVCRTLRNLVAEK